MHPREAPPTTSSAVDCSYTYPPVGYSLTTCIAVSERLLRLQGFPEGTRTQLRNAAAPPTRAHEQLRPDALTTAHERAAWQQERAAMENEYAEYLSVPFEYAFSVPLECTSGSPVDYSLRTVSRSARSVPGVYPESTRSIPLVGKCTSLILPLSTR